MRPNSSKYRDFCPTGIPAKKSCDSGKKQEFLRPPPKPRSCEKFLRKTQGKKEILRNPGRNGFFGPKNKFLKTGIFNLGWILSSVLQDYYLRTYVSYLLTYVPMCLLTYNVRFMA
jgi:hypothetical protein